jgi:hypothetical protein
MNARELVLMQFKQVHKFFEATIADCEQDLIDRRLDGASINHIGAIYAHVVLAEDVLVNERVRGATTVFDAGDWATRLGVPKAELHQDESWGDLRVDLPSFREYAAEVYKSTEEFLTKATDEELGREIGESRKMSAVGYLGLIGTLHVAEHWGEIAALKGVTGAKGLPF